MRKEWHSSVRRRGRVEAYNQEEVDNDMCLEDSCSCGYSCNRTLVEWHMGPLVESCLLEDTS